MLPEVCPNSKTKPDSRFLHPPSKRQKSKQPKIILKAAFVPVNKFKPFITPSPFPVIAN
jgi:hypothetical protein